MIINQNNELRGKTSFKTETNLPVRTQATTTVSRDAEFHFDLLRQNQPGREFSVPYEHYRNRSAIRQWLSRFMEANGFSLF